MHETEADIQHRKAAGEKLSNEGRKYFKFVEFDANEELVSEIRKHFFGLFLVLLGGLVVILAILALGFLLLAADLNSFFGADGLDGIKPAIGVAFFLLLILALIGIFIAVFLYRSNVIFVTSEKIAQVVYVSLFNRKISQLSIGDVQDASVHQRGIFAHIFNYGTLVIETAGEQQNYTFTYVPDPYTQSKLIVGAHEENLKKYGN